MPNWPGILRLLVRERLVAGDSDEAVIDYVVSRYGEFVLLTPRFSVQTRAAVGRAGADLAARRGIVVMLINARGRDKMVAVTTPGGSGLSRGRTGRTRESVGRP
jgi:cytochrome c-type biogenesis protein CcmH